MNDSKVLRWTGAFGVTAGVLLLVASPLYVVLGTPPSLGDEALFAAYVTRSNIIAIATKLVDVVYLVGFMVFAAGLRHLIRRVRPDDEWLAALVFGSALVQAASVLVFDAPPRRGSPRHVQPARPQRSQSTHRGLPGHDCIQLPPDGALLGGGELRHPGHACEASVGWLAVGIVILNPVAVPAIFEGNDFLEAVVAGVTTSAGWYVSINDVMGLAFIGWLISVGIAMMLLSPKAVVLALQERELQGTG
jgi:hypothetical protein